MTSKIATYLDQEGNPRPWDSLSAEERTAICFEAKTGLALWVAPSDGEETPPYHKKTDGRISAISGHGYLSPRGAK